MNVQLTRERKSNLSRADLLALLALVITVLAGYFEIAFLGKTFSGAATVAGVNGFNAVPGQPAVAQLDFYRVDRGASAWQFEPWAAVTNASLQKGRLPLWNEFQGLGAPHAANMQSAALDPLLVLVNLRPTALMWDVHFLATFIFGAAATYFFAKKIGLPPLPAMTTATIFVLSGFFDVGAEAVVEASAQQRDALIDADLTYPFATVVPVGSASIIEYLPDQVKVDVVANRPGMLVLTAIFYPGWEVEVNGQPTDILPTDVAFRGVLVPRGRSQVVFRYRPTSFRIGIMLGGVALGCVAVLGVLRRRSFKPEP